MNYSVLGSQSNESSVARVTNVSPKLSKERGKNGKIFRGLAFCYATC